MTTSHTFNYDSDNDDDDHKYVYDGKDVTIFVIDCNPKKFDRLEYARDVNREAESFFDLSLNVIESLLLEKLRKNNSNEMVAILLYNTDKADTSSDIIAPDNCAVLFLLQQISVAMIRKIKNIRDSPDCHDFSNKFGHSTRAKISDVLWLCSSVTNQVKIHTLMINWFTNTSEPHNHKRGSEDFKEAMYKAEEFQYLQPDFQLIPLNVDFDFNQFYKPFALQLTGIDEEDFINPDIEWNSERSEVVQKIVERLLRHNYNNRALSYVTFEMTEKTKFGVGVYNFTRKKSEPKSILLDRVTKHPIESKRQYMYGEIPENDQNNESLDRSIVLNERLTADIIIKYIEVGLDKITFTPMELYESKQVMQPKIKLLGFKPLSAFNAELHLRSPYFIYPSERHIKGSTTAFRCLWQNCLEMEKFALCIFTMRLKSFPRVVALIPQCANQDKNMFDGFRMEFMPYASDVRDLHSMYDHHEKEDIGDELSKLVGQFIRKLGVNYDPTVIKNPNIEKIFDKIECTVFDENFEESQDNSIPKVDEQHARTASIVEQIAEQIDGFDEKEEEEGVKRKTTESAEGQTARKKVASEDINVELLLEKCKSGNTKNITVSMMRDYLKLKNIAGLSKMTRNDLINQIVNLN